MVKQRSVSDSRQGSSSTTTMPPPASVAMRPGRINRRTRYGGPPGSLRYNCATFEDRAKGNESMVAGREAVSGLIRKIASAMDGYTDVVWGIVHGGDREGCEEHFELRLDFSGRAQRDENQEEEGNTSQGDETETDGEQSSSSSSSISLSSASPSPDAATAPMQVDSVVPNTTTVPASPPPPPSPVSPPPPLSLDVAGLCHADPMVQDSDFTPQPPPAPPPAQVEEEEGPLLRKRGRPAASAYEHELDDQGRPYVCVRCWDNRPPRDERGHCRRCRHTVRAARDTVPKPTRYFDSGCLECEHPVSRCRCPRGAIEGCRSCGKKLRVCLCPFKSDVHPELGIREERVKHQPRYRRRGSDIYT